VQRKTAKGKPTGSVKIAKALVLSLFAALLVLAIPFVVRWYKAEQLR
jgi:hypothetical protein